MEEILASIRRIIADDQEVLRGASRDRGTPSSLANVLDLTERQTAQMVASSSHEAEDREPETERRSERAYDEVDHAENDLQLVSYHDEPEDAPEDFTQLSEGIVIPAEPTRFCRAPRTPRSPMLSRASDRPSCRPNLRPSTT